MSSTHDIDPVLTSIEADLDLRAAFKAAARGFQDRNTLPLHAKKSRDFPEFSQLLELLGVQVQANIETLTCADATSLTGKVDYRNILDSICADRKDASLEELTWSLAVHMLYKYFDGLDTYVEKLSDFKLVQELGLEVDDEGLVNLNNPRLKILRHGMSVDQSDRLYLHQFLRRCFNGNFVDLPLSLGKALQLGYTVKARIDPIRHGAMADYMEIVEAGHWFGPKFDLAVLDSKDGSESRTVHGTSDNSRTRILGMTYPISQTHFRTSMMDIDKGLRQFSIEEYVPLQTSENRRPPGFGDKYHIQKFAHFVYDQKKKTFEHLDCAVRVFNIKEYVELLKKVQSGSTIEKRAGKRYKLFKVSGDLGIELIQDLLGQYFLYNDHLQEYFGNAKASTPTKQ